MTACASDGCVEYARDGYGGSEECEHGDYGEREAYASLRRAKHTQSTTASHWRRGEVRRGRTVVMMIMMAVRRMRVCSEQTTRMLRKE
jgi:hypothetical protein